MSSFLESAMAMSDTSSDGSSNQSKQFDQSLNSGHDLTSENESNSSPVRQSQSDDDSFMIDGKLTQQCLDEGWSDEINHKYLGRRVMQQLINEETTVTGTIVAVLPVESSDTGFL